ncbi:MAG: tRNA pseudouridine(38-40) synthase TruA [Bacillota bacterium]|nr:tRNA pseudouridine(38-40) synthase TruA [Bacillota bacterium]MDW7729460.1 tRNA pseudouridine(38-40) synthase TruA [Bacillota bacterium]
MPNILITISYDGTNYSGFQIQANAPTIQEEIERALAVIYKEPVRVASAGRTDTGVHARGQAASFKPPFYIEPHKLPHAINSLLPADVVVIYACEVAENFHARFDARRKTYSYSIDCAPFPQVLQRLYRWHIPEVLDLEKMQVAADIFVGTHDFKSFHAAGSNVSETTRTIYRIEIKETFPQQLILTYTGSGFLYRMVRLITGTLVRVGRGVITPADALAALEGINPLGVGPTAPAQGLCLEEVTYDLFAKNKD